MLLNMAYNICCYGIIIRNFRNLVIRSQSVIRPISVISSQIGVKSDQLRVSLYGHVPECHVTSLCLMRSPYRP